MSRITVIPAGENKDSSKRHRRSESRWLRVTRIVARVLVGLILIGAIASYFYWQSLKNTPQYSLALLIDAAKRDDLKAVDSLVNVDAVVDDLIPQITGKAAELYGRGLPPQVIAKMTSVAAPILPAVKDRARAELPRLIRDRMERFPNMPFAVMVVGVDRYMDIKVSGDTAIVRSKLPERPLEMKMRRNGVGWQIVGVKDDELATNIARAIGQQIIAIATNGMNKRTAETLSVGNLADLLRQAEELVK
ncbi:MAG: hypothetical protein ACKVQJ_03290 [Pyrinomonadaceae bacterium]